MDDMPQKPVSEISERADIRDLAPLNFLAAIGWGSVAGTLAISASSLLRPEPTALLWQYLGAIIFVSLFTMLFSLAGMILIGLPVTFLLRIAGVEHRYVYGVIGGVAGFIVITHFFGTTLPPTPERLAMPVSGGVAGFAAAVRWGRWREAVASFLRRETDEARHTDKRTNHIHDLIH